MFVLVCARLGGRLSIGRSLDGWGQADDAKQPSESRRFDREASTGFTEEPEIACDRSILKTKRKEDKAHR